MSHCLKKPKNTCRRTNNCFFTNGPKRFYCRKSGKKTCRGQSRSNCSHLAKCQYTRGAVKYCRRKTQRKHK